MCACARVCVYVLACILLFVYIWLVFIILCTCIMCIFACVYLYPCVHVFMCICTFVCVCVFVVVCAYLYFFVCVRLDMNVYMYLACIFQFLNFSSYLSFHLLLPLVVVQVTPCSSHTSVLAFTTAATTASTLYQYERKERTNE